MTLETKGSYDTTAYETKSLKKRILHMKKKLTVAQQEAQEAAGLRAAAEDLRAREGAARKAGAAKDARITELEAAVAALRRPAAAGAGGRVAGAPSRTSSGASSATGGSSRTSSGGSGRFAATAAATKGARSAATRPQPTKPPSKKWFF